MATAPQFHMPDEADEPPREDGRGRAAIAIALVSLLVGIGATLGVQALLEQQGPRSEQAARQAVLGYLQAIAAGDDETADRALLGSAQRAAAQPSSIAAEGRLRSPRITEVQLGDGTARVDVSYAVADRTILARIEAVFADGAWRMQRALGETVPIGSTLSVPVRIDAIGVVPATRTLLLLPGRHTIAPIDTPLVTMAGSTVDVDGDPRTASAIDLEPALTDAALAQLASTGAAFVAACSADRSCGLPEGFDAAALADPIVVPFSGQAGEVAVQLPIASGEVGSALEVVGRMSPDLTVFEGMSCALAGEQPRPCGP